MLISKSIPGTLTTRSVVAAIAILGGSVCAQAQVQPGDTFNFDVISFNATTGAASFVTPKETATFGATTTFTGAGANGQDITITSGESKSGATTTDTFTVSTPTNFLAANNSSQAGLEFDIGNGNAGTNAVDLVGPISTQTSTGFLLSSFGMSALTPSTTLSNGGQSYSALESVFTLGAPVSFYGVHSFTYIISYTNASAPEPSAVALLCGGLLILGGSVRRRRDAR